MPGDSLGPDGAAPRATLPWARARRIQDRIRAKWTRLSSGSANRQMFGTAVLISFLTLGIKLVSLVRESFVAATFGTRSDYDAFIIGLLMPSFLTAILSGSLNAALMPTFIEIREQRDAETAERLYTSILMWNTVALVFVSLALAGTAKLWLPLIASGFGPEKLALTRSLMYWSLPIVVIAGFSTTWGALLNAGNRFALVAIAPALQPAGTVLVLAVLFRHMGIYALLAGTMLGMALEAALVGWALARRGHHLLPRWHGVTEEFRKVLGQYGACIAAAFIVSGQSVVDQSFASSLGPRSNAALNYGSKLVTLVLSLGAYALATAILPQLSKMVAVHDWRGIRKFIRLYGSVILAVTVPGCLLLGALSPWIIRVMYQRGAFTSADTALVVKIQMFYLFRIPSATFGVLVTRTLTALRANQVMLYVSFGSFALNAILDYVFMLRFGIAGITLSTSVCSWLVILSLAVAMYRILDQRAREPQP